MSAEVCVGTPREIAADKLEMNADNNFYTPILLYFDTSEPQNLSRRSLTQKKKSKSRKNNSEPLKRKITGINRIDRFFDQHPKSEPTAKNAKSAKKNRNTRQGYK